MHTTQTLQKPNKKSLKLGTKTATNPYSKDNVLAAAEEEAEQMINNKNYSIKPTSQVFQAIGIMELDEGYLMLRAVTTDHKAFALELYRQLVNEYNCQTPSSKLRAMTAVLSYCRILKAQQEYNSMLDTEFLSSYKVGWLNTLNKELDRANRHFMASIQALEQQSRPPIRVSVKTNTANIAQQQIVNQCKDNDQQ